MAIKLKRGLEATIPTLQEGEPGFTTDTKKLFVGSDAGNIEIGALIEVTWQELKDKRDAGLLTPGQQYRITDYVTTTVQENTQSAGHQFDIIVTADDVDKLNENARACLHEGDTYFANSKLEAWKLMYCLDNDADRFAWADEENGKGVIYRMIDEFNNDVPYDFKNIQFIRKITDGEYDPDGIDTWVYTFTGFSYENNTLVDGTTLKASEYFTDEGSNLYKNNSIGVYEVRRFTEDGFDNILETLSNNVFIGRYDETPYSEDGPSKLVLFSFNNELGRDCYGNTFGYSVYNNSFGNSVYGNTFGNNVYNNTFGNDVYGNTFGNGVGDNTFGNRCHSNTFGDGCYRNTFGNYCFNNTFGDGCSSNTFGNYCYYLKISDNTYIQKKCISVDNGFNGASSANRFDLYDPAIANKDYQVTFKKSASGKYLMLWATDTGTMTGKVKDSNLDNTWEDIV